MFIYRFYLLVIMFPLSSSLSLLSPFSFPFPFSLPSFLVSSPSSFFPFFHPLGNFLFFIQHPLRIFPDLIVNFFLLIKALHSIFPRDFIIFSPMLFTAALKVWSGPKNLRFHNNLYKILFSVLYNFLNGCQVLVQEIVRI